MPCWRRRWSSTAARYATPYGFVRALQAPRDHVSPRRTCGRRGALLTVHGAKGLEAEVVFVMDADPEPPPAETATLLVDWPVRGRPRRGAAPSSTARVAARPSLQTCWPTSGGAPPRGAQRPVRGDDACAPAARVQRHAAAPRAAARRRAGGSASRPLAAALGACRRRAGAGRQPVEPPSWCRVAALGRRRAPSARRRARRATAPPAAGPAVHRVLEWASRRRRQRLSALAGRGRRAEFGAPRGRGGARCRPHPRQPGLRALLRRPRRCSWAGNEVPVGLAGAVLRIDRLVLLDEEGADGLVGARLQAAAPAAGARRLPRAAAALPRRRAGRRSPASAVRSAFIAGDGRLVESA